MKMGIGFGQIEGYGFYMNYFGFVLVDDFVFVFVICVRCGFMSWLMCCVMKVLMWYVLRVFCDYLDEYVMDLVLFCQLCLMSVVFFVFEIQILRFEIF